MRMSVHFCDTTYIRKIVMPWSLNLQGQLQGLRHSCLEMAQKQLQNSLISIENNATCSFLGDGYLANNLLKRIISTINKSFETFEFSIGIDNNWMQTAVRKCE